MHPLLYSNQGSCSSQARGDAIRTRASFSTTAQYGLDGLPREYIQALQQELLRLMHERPEILSAVKEYMQAVTDHGIDFPGHVLPRDMTYARFMQQKDMTETGQKMCQAFLDAGVNISIEVLAMSLMEMQRMVKYL